MFLGVQIVSIGVVLCVLLGFVGIRKVPTLSTTWYKCCIGAAINNFIFEAFSLTTLYHTETVSPSLNRIAHQLFVISLVVFLHCFLMFVEMRGRNQRRYTVKELVVRLIPFMMVVPIVLFGEVKYYVDGMTRYSYGSMILGIRIVVAMYILAYFILVIHFRKKFSDREINALIFSFLVMFIIGNVQGLHPSYLLSSMGVSLLVLNVFIAFENPRLYADLELEHALNKTAFFTMINECVEAKREFYIVSLTLANSAILKDAKGYNKTVEYMDDAAKYVMEYAHTKLIFHPKRDWVSVVFTDKQKYYAFMEEQRELFAIEGHEEHGSGKFFLNVLKCPEYADSLEEIVAVLDYVDKIKADIQEKIFRIDESVLENKRFVKQIEAVVQTAIDEDGFEVYYQPIYSTKDKKFVSSEALVRLKDTTTLGYISPEIFIPIAEENGMIRAVGNQVFQKVCRFIKEKKLQEYGVEYIEVNLSGAQFMDDQLNIMLLECAKEYDVPPEFINLEITETASIAAGDLLEYNMRRLKENNFKFSMDDFGTGYSNLAKIAQTDFDLIKLDKSLIWPCFERDEMSKESRIILESSVDMILKLGKDIVAEGGETLEQAEYLTEHGVKYLQGFYYSKPLSEEGYLEFVKEHQ